MKLPNTKRCNLFKFLLRTKTINLFLIGIFLPVLFSLIVALMNHLLPDIFTFPDGEDVSEKIRQNPRLLIIALLVAPFSETLLQYVPVKFASTYKQKKYRYINFLAILLSAVVFGYIHDGFAFMIFIPLFFAGFVWATLCLVFIKREILPYISVAAIHAMYNAILLTLDRMLY